MILLIRALTNVFAKRVTIVSVVFECNVLFEFMATFVVYRPLLVQHLVPLDTTVLWPPRMVQFSVVPLEDTEQPKAFMTHLALENAVLAITAMKAQPRLLNINVV